jgi:hypothetical protein
LALKEATSVNYRRKKIVVRLLKTSWYWLPLLPIDLFLQVLIKIGDIAQQGRDLIEKGYFIIKH